MFMVGSWCGTAGSAAALSIGRPPVRAATGSVVIPADGSGLRLQAVSDPGAAHFTLLAGQRRDVGERKAGQYRAGGADVVVRAPSSSRAVSKPATKRARVQSPAVELSVSV